MDVFRIALLHVTVQRHFFKSNMDLTEQTVPAFFCVPICVAVSGEVKRTHFCYGYYGKLYLINHVMLVNVWEF
jgi:hypothetical protein